MAYTKQQIIALRADLDTFLEEFAKKHNLVKGHCQLNYGPTDFTVKVEFGDKSADPMGVDPRYKRDLIAGGAYVGLDIQMLGTKLHLPGKGGRSNYEFAGMRASKAVCLCLDEDRKPYLWDAKFIAQQIKLQKNA